MGLHHINSPLKIRGQVLPSGSTGVMIFWGRSQLRVFAPSWQINVLPSRQVSDGDSCRRINSAVMKIRLFKPKTPSNTQKYPSQPKPSIHRLAFAWKAITFITAGHRPTDKDITTIAAWKAERLQLHRRISTPAKKEQTKRKFVI